MTRYDRAPHPFVLSVGLGRRERAENDSDLIFGLRLFGKACKAAPFILRAFEEAGARGLGGQRVPFRLEQIELEDVAEAHWLPGQSYPEPAERDPPTALSKHVKLIFLTPLRLMSNGRLCSPDNFDASAMAMALVRRVGLINTFFGDRESSMDFSTLKTEAKAIITLSRSLRWRKLSRYSNRQKARQSIGGLIGTVELDLSQTPQMRQILAWAPIVHIGKGTSMGLGRVELAP